MIKISLEINSHELGRILDPVRKEYVHFQDLDPAQQRDMVEEAIRGGNDLLRLASVKKIQPFHWNGEEVLRLLTKFSRDQIELMDSPEIRDLVKHLVDTSNPGPFLADLLEKCGSDSVFAADFPEELVERVTKYLKEKET